MQTEMSDYEIELQNKKIDKLDTIIILLKMILAVMTIFLMVILMLCGTKG